MQLYWLIYYIMLIIMITSKHSKKITSSNPPVIVVLLLIPPSSPRQPPSFDSAAIHLSGWLLCLLSVYCGRDDCPRWMNLLFIFCRIIHPARLIVVLFQTFSAPACPRPHPDWLLCGFCCFCGPPWPLSFRPEVNRRPEPSFVHLWRPLAVAVPKIEAQ